jgi:predicted RNase H-like HicB family nuclease
MRKATYIAVLEPAEDGAYGIYFPDVTGCVSLGTDLDDCKAKAEEALGLHIYGMEQDGDALPERTDELPELAAGSLVMPITVYPDLVKDRLDNRREKTTVTLPHWLKVSAEANGVNYSRVLESALKETLAA